MITATSFSERNQVEEPSMERRSQAGPDARLLIWPGTVDGDGETEHLPQFRLYSLKDRFRLVR